jgi:MoaA/NifB/PqqE/SkfB family radical SAM enzyme
MTESLACPPLPAFLQIEPVGTCNLACRMCPVRYREATGDRKLVDVAAFRRLVAEMSDARELQLQGLGEPLLHPRLFEMVEYAVGRGHVVAINSNMTLMSARRAEECVASGLHRLHASIDAATPARYEWIRSGGVFGRALRGIERVQRAKERAGSALPTLELVMVLMRANLGELPGIVTLAHALGVPRVAVQPLCHDFSEPTLPARYAPMRSFVATQALGPADRLRLERSARHAEEAAAGLGVELRLPPLVTEPAATGGRCGWPWRGAYVAYGGEAMPCCMVSTPDRVTLGNVFEAGALAVWHGAAYRDFRTRLAGPTPPAVCRGCALYAGAA